MMLWSALALLSLGQPTQILTLEEALRLAKQSRPLIQSARATARAADARVDATLAPLLPEVSGSASYARQTGNFVARPGQLPSTVTQTVKGANFDTFGFWNFAANANWQLFDFGGAWSSRAAAKASRAALYASAEATEGDVALAVESAFFTAWGQSALVGVAKAGVEAAQGHLSQTQAMVSVGTKPELDLAQVKADLASARLDLVKAENAALLAKAQLVRVLGAPMPEASGPVIGGMNPPAGAIAPLYAFEVADEEPSAVPGEDGAVGALADQAAAARPELRALSAQSLSLVEQRDAVWAGYFPSLSLGSGFNLLGANLDAMTWNWNAQLTLSWSIWKGGSTSAALRENDAQQEAALAQLEEQRLGVRAEVREAQLAVGAAKAAAVATAELDAAASERLRLAEGRYAAGAGTIIELEDAQLAATSAKAQVVQVRVQLAVARAQLRHALGGAD